VLLFFFIVSDAVQTHYSYIHIYIYSPSHSIDLVLYIHRLNIHTHTHTYIPDSRRFVSLCDENDV